ncbi:MAG: hypothetical protein R2766_01400 [Saprospiraceae bacterium]
MTFVFTSDASVTYSGWVADITCSAPCNASNNIILTTSDVTATILSSCDVSDTGWTYYGNGSGDYVFAIDWGTGNNTAKDDAIINIYTGVQASVEATGIPEATYTMNRRWDVDLQGSSLSSPVSVRFYYDPLEKSSIENLASTFASNNGVSVQTFSWFKSDCGSSWNESMVTSTNPGANLIDLTPNATYGTENGITYVEFANVS